MDINPDDETSYTTQYQEAFLKYVENEYCAKHRCVLVNKQESLPSSNLIPSAPASGSCQSSFDPYDSSSDDAEYLISNNVAETTPRLSDCAAHLLTGASLYLNLPPAAPNNWGHIDSNLNDYHSDEGQMGSTFGYRTQPTGAINRKKCTQSTPISQMCRATYSLSYHMVSQYRPGFP